MDETSDMIEREIENTRSHLADRLEILGNKIAGTVEEVEETVEDVTETAENTIQKIKDLLNLQKQTQQHPWVILGGAVVVGYVSERLLEAVMSVPEQPAPSAQPAYVPYTYPIPQQGDGRQRAAIPEQGDGRQRAAAREEGNGRHRATTAELPPETTEEPAEKGLLTNLANKFEPELNTLKKLAIGTLFGVARDMMTQSLPSAIQEDVEQVMDSATERAGGKPIHGKLVPEAEQNRTEEMAPAGSVQ